MKAALAEQAWDVVEDIPNDSAAAVMLVEHRWAIPLRDAILRAGGFPISDGFIMLIRSVVPLIIFATVAVGIAKMGDMRRVGVVGLRAIIYFEVVSTIALVVGLIVGNLWQPGAGLHIAPASLDEKAVAGYVSNAKSLTIQRSAM